MRPDDGAGYSPAEFRTAEDGVRITVVVPVLNAMRFLPHTVPSLLEAVRDTEGVELVYVDNGSTDSSYEYLSSVGKDGVSVTRLERDPREATRNLSAAARNFGAGHARGEFLSFLDAD